MIVNLINERKFKKFESRIPEVYKTACETLGIDDSILEVNVTAVSKRVIKKTNKEFRNVDKVTDVLSFPTLVNENNDIIKTISLDMYPYDINPETNAVMIGDVYICMSRVFKQAKEYGNTREREVCYMLLHSFLHLLGYDHIEENDKKIMRSKEEEILSKLKIVR